MVYTWTWYINLCPGISISQFSDQDRKQSHEDKSLSVYVCKDWMIIMSRLEDHVPTIPCSATVLFVYGRFHNYAENWILAGMFLIISQEYE